MLIDQPKPGFSNTNDGNTARRFFKNKKTADITGLDADLNHRLNIILITISSFYEINSEILICEGYMGFVHEILFMVLYASNTA